MGLVNRLHQSGLVLAEHGEDEARLRRALKQMDDRLRLLPPDALCRYWRVMRQIADDRPAVHVLTWMDADGRPLPLSSGLLEEVAKHRRDSRQPLQTADERNDQLVAAVRRERDDAIAALHDEFEPYLERGRKGVTFATSRKRRYWQRDNGVHR